MKQAHPSLQYRPLSKRAYFSELKQKIDATRPGSRILVTTMNLDMRSPEVRAITTSLAHAAKRGAHVIFAFDAYNFFVDPINRQFGPLFIHRTIPKMLSPTYTRLINCADELKQAGVKVYVTNQPTRAFTSPFAGRSHIKAAVINDELMLGGCNLDDPSNIDLMIAFEDKVAADWLYETLGRAAGAPHVWKALGKQDQHLTTSDEHLLMVDAGVRSQSAIYEKALGMIEESQDWLTITCQFFPNGDTAKKLLAAQKRGVKVRILYNHPFKHKGLSHQILQSLVRERERLRMPKEFFNDELPFHSPFLHAKLLACEKGFVIGSHNYVRAGVDFGTAEIALTGSNPAIAVQLVTAIDMQLQLLQVR